jgi:hypothetical protein
MPNQQTAYHSAALQYTQVNKPRTKGWPRPRLRANFVYRQALPDAAQGTAIGGQGEGAVGRSPLIRPAATFSLREKGLNYYAFSGEQVGFNETRK